MSIKVVQPEIERFLSDRQAGVLVMAGKWGVGKTFAWNRFVKLAKDHGRFGAPRYAYVSLFGLGSLEELKAAIFQNTINESHIGQAADLDTLDDVVRNAKGLWRKGGSLARLFPGADKYLSTFERVGFFWVKDQVICIDDLERKSRALEMRDVLGLVSYLREQRGCKVVLLLNDEKMGPEDGPEFRNQLEKVADVMLRFEPTAAEAAEIGLDPSMPFYALVRRNCETLGIVNIRTIQKIERIAKRLKEELRAFDPRVLDQALNSLALFAFAKLQPDDAPSIEFIRALNTYQALEAREHGTEPEHAPQWRALLDEYHFTMFDEFDGVILNILQQGHFDEPLLKREAEKIDAALKASDENKSFSDAWDIYHDSFDNNGDEVAEKLANAVQTTPKAISPVNLSGTISLLKDVEWNGDIKALIDSYIAGRADASPEFWDLDKSAFGGDVTDPDVRAAFQARLASVQIEPMPAELLIELGRTRTWTEETLTVLGKLTIDELYNIFKELRDTDLKRAVAGALLFRNMTGASDSMQQLTKNATEALVKIAAESPINHRRVLQKGVELPAEPADAAPVTAAGASPVNENDPTSGEVAQDQQ